MVRRSERVVRLCTQAALALCLLAASGCSAILDEFWVA